MHTKQHISFRVEEGDALTYNANILALKYAQGFYGVDGSVARRLFHGLDSFPELPPDGFRLFPSGSATQTDFVLFVGVEPLREFGYREIREFGRKVLISLAGEAPAISHLCLTIHGPGYGLDETEAFESELAGLLDSIATGDLPTGLRQITFIERNPARAGRLRLALNRLLPQGAIEVGRFGDLSDEGVIAADLLKAVGLGSEKKPHIFVAMPFAEEMDDVFYFGIENVVKAAGFLCERADLSSFTGNVVEWIKQRIENSTLVIAELTSANPNVYLEVGYAWGSGRPTILLCRDAAELKFDVRDQRCLIYKRIIDLERSLRKELANLAIIPAAKSTP
jgi:hypothetical protein